MRFHFGVAAACAFLTPTASLYAQSPPPAEDSTPKSQSGVIAAPYAKYAPETSVAIGVSALYYFHFNNEADPATANRPSSTSGGVTYTLKNQLSTGMDYSLYLAHDKIYVFGGFDYKKIPYDFFGIGDHNPVDRIDSYTPLWVGGDLLVTYNFIRTAHGEGLNAGLCSEVRHDKLLSSDAGGPLQARTVPGSEGGLSAGLGMMMTYDTRDNTFSAHDGQFVDLRTMFYGKAIGSDFNFNRLTLDVRDFIPLAPKQTLALQGLFTMVGGYEPFYTMSRLGGELNMRGYFEGRFRDHDMLVFQSEYRFPVWWRFGAVAFADVGEVANDEGAFTFSGAKVSAGAGIRFLLSEEERVTVRLDYGVGYDSSELYFSINEAF